MSHVWERTSSSRFLSSPCQQIRHEPPPPPCFNDALKHDKLFRPPFPPSKPPFDFPILHSRSDGEGKLAKWLSDGLQCIVPCLVIWNWHFPDQPNSNRLSPPPPPSFLVECTYLAWVVVIFNSVKGEEWEKEREARARRSMASKHLQFPSISDQSIHPSIDQLLHQSINYYINQSTTTPINWLITSINQLINQLILE